MSTRNQPRAPGSCPRPVRQPRRGDTLARVVADYITYCRERADEERRRFADLPLREAVRLAGLAVVPGDVTRFSHQRRIPAAVLRRAAERLQQVLPRLRACRTFAALYGVVHDTLAGVRGIGPLTVYDTANRIGGRLRLEPTRVYLHAGTLEGARALGLPTNEDGTVEISRVPTALRRLRAREVEDALCIFERRLRSIMTQRRRQRAA